MSNPKKEFSKIYDDYINKIYRFIFLKVNSQEIAEDLCSEAFLKGWEAFKNGPVIENPQAFLYQIARNLVVDYYREKGRTKTVSADCLPIIDPKTDLEGETLLTSDIDSVKSALTGLKEDYQNMIIWRYIDDLKIGEIAKMADKSEGAVRVTIHRALKALKNEIEQA